MMGSNTRIMGLLNQEKSFINTSGHFDIIQECAGQTDRQTDGQRQADGQYCAYAWHRGVKTCFQPGFSIFGQCQYLAISCKWYSGTLTGSHWYLIIHVIPMTLSNLERWYTRGPVSPVNIHTYACTGDQQ